MNDPSTDDSAATAPTSADLRATTTGVSTSCGSAMPSTLNLQPLGESYEHRERNAVFRRRRSLGFFTHVLNPEMGSAGAGAFGSHD